MRFEDRIDEPMRFASPSIDIEDDGRAPIPDDDSLGHDSPGPDDETTQTPSNNPPPPPPDGGGGN